MSFRLKLGFSFGAILLFTVIVAMTGMYGMNHALQHQKNLYEFTGSLEKNFQIILREQQIFVNNGDIKHSRSVLILISKIKKNINTVLKTIHNNNQKIRVENVLSTLAEYEDSFEKVSGNTVDMETMKSRMLHESKRFITNINAIEKFGHSAVPILKVLNEMLMAEKNFILVGKTKFSMLVQENSKGVIDLANDIRITGEDSSTRLYAFRISNIATAYLDSFLKFVNLYNMQQQSISEMSKTFSRFENELDVYKNLVVQKEQKDISLLQNLVVFISFLVIGLGLFAIFFLSKLITIPINNLKASATRVLSGNLETKVQVLSQDEIGDLSIIFNEMTRKLKQNFDSLKEYQDHLEELVRERTLNMENEIEKHKNTQEALKIEKDRALQYFDITGSILVVLNSNGTVDLINNSGSKLLGYPKEMIVGKNWFDNYIPEHVREKTKERFDNLMAGNIKSIEFTENKIVNKQGEKRVISWHNNVIFDTENNIIATLSSGEDITHIIKMEEEKKKLEGRLQQARKMEAIGTLAGGIAHDFNNILFPIMGNAELAMLNLPEESNVRKKLDSILQGALRAKGLIQQILMFSRQKEKLKKPLKIQPILREVIKLLRSAISKNIEIQLDIDDETHDVLGDSTEIYEIIMNLCTNAYHSMEKTGGCLTVKVKESYVDNDNFNQLNLREGLYCIISVIDTGEGIPKKNMNQIFDPYFTTKKIGKGSGLGLSVIHGIVKDYDGIISVDSEIGKGSEFSVYLPTTLDMKPVQKDSSEENDAVTSVGNEHVLFVDDEVDIVNMGVQVLRNLGYTVTGKTDSYTALQTFEKEPDIFDLVITDMAMPGMVGTELVKRIKDIKPNIPVIICTGFSDHIDSNKAKLLGINGFIRKPILIHELSHKIRDVLKY